MSKTFYIADMHFGHSNILKYDKRPFGDTAEQEKTLIENWNRVVSEKDTVYILGDFSMEKEEKTCELLDALNGKKHLIKGNHDKVSSKVKSRYKSVNEYLEINDNGTRVILCHYPIVFYNKCLTHNTVHLYGHVHITSEHDYIERFRKEIIKEEEDNRFGPQHPCLFFNVGCMMPYMNYTPRTLKEILERA